jgi:hypothetical protein
MDKIIENALINKTSAQIIASSVHAGAADPRRDITRLDSIYQVFPKMVLGEANRHRGHSCSDRSSRAVPPEKLIEEIRSGHGLAMPAKFYKRAKGMGHGEEMIGDELYHAQARWVYDALAAADAAEFAMEAGEEKETVNRRLDMYIYMHTLRTGVRDIWLNYLGLRLDPTASSTIILAAQKVFEVYKEVTPTPLQPGEWHIPFLVGEDHKAVMESCLFYGGNGERYSSVEVLEKTINFSAARCAHLSYNDLATGKRMILKRSLEIAKNLRDSRPFHASPFEHQATPDEHSLSPYQVWKYPDQHGNLPGWRQARKMIPGEAVAPLPEGYEF